MRGLAPALCAAFALAAAAFAEPHAEVDPALDSGREWLASPVEYNQALVDASEAVVRRLEDAEHEIASLPPVAHFEAWRLAALAAFAEGRARVEGIAERPYDQGYRAAVIDTFVTAEQVFEVALPEAFALFMKEHVRNADLARLEALFREMDESIARCDERVVSAQRAFARASGLRLQESRERAPRERSSPPFTAPGIPPAGSRLEGQIHVAFAIRHGNELVELQNTLASSARRMMEASSGAPAAIEAVRKQELEQVRAVRALVQQLEPWQGDDTMRQGCLEMARQLEAVLDGELKRLSRMLAKGIESQRDADRANALIDEINAAMQRAHEAFSSAAQRFRQRWAFEAYEAWQAAQPEPAPPERPRPAPDSERPPAPPRPLPQGEGPPA